MDKSNQTPKRRPTPNKLLLRIRADLQKEMVRQTNPVVIADLEDQIQGLKELHEELEKFSKLKEIIKSF